MPQPSYRVASPPPRSLILYDGDCPFCQRWAERWQSGYTQRLDVQPYQSARHRFPEIPDSAHMEALQLVEPDGAVYSGAYAALRARARGRSKRGALLALYESVPVAPVMLELGYRIVARHRRVFSMLMRG